MTFTIAFIGFIVFVAAFARAYTVAKSGARQAARMFQVYAVAAVVAGIVAAGAHEAGFLFA